MRRHDEAGLFDRFIAVTSYLTLGFTGMIWFLLNAIVLRKPMKVYLTYNLVQSFVLSILYAIFTLLYDILMGILVNIPFIGSLFFRLHIFLFETPVFNTLSFVNFILIIFAGYLSLVAAFGQLPRIPFITDVVKKAFR